MRIRRGLVTRLLSSAPTSPLIASSMLALLIVLAWLVNFGAGGAHVVPPHLFYVPVLLAATWFGPWGILLVAVAATLTAGPLLPADTATGTAQLPSDWIVRGMFFLAMGQLVGVLTRSLQSASAREHEIADREARLAHDKAALLRGLSHELRTPLAILTGAGTMLQGDEVGSATATELWSAHGRALRRLETLLAVSIVLNDEHGAPGREAFQIGGLAHAQIAALPRVDTDRVVLERGATEHVLGDAAFVGLLLRVLIDNALRYSPEDATVEVGAERQGDVVTVTVTDHGSGLDPHDLERLTRAFAQGRDSTSNVQGLGLGLAAAARLAALLGTNLALAPGTDGGTTISFTLPASTSAPPRRSTAATLDERLDTATPKLDGAGPELGEAQLMGRVAL